MPVRIARHVVPRQLEWRAAWAPRAPRLPADETSVTAQTALIEILHGRESRRWPALRSGAAALVRRHCPERTVVVTTADATADGKFRQLAGVTAVERRENDVAIRGHGDELVSQVIQCLASHAIPVIDFRTEMPNLEDVFLRLTGHSVRS